MGVHRLSTPFFKIFFRGSEIDAGVGFQRQPNEL